MAIMAGVAGMSYPGMLQAILDCAWRRTQWICGRRSDTSAIARANAMAPLQLSLLAGTRFQVWHAPSIRALRLATMTDNQINTQKVSCTC